MAPRREVGPFTKGLVTDVIGVEGALLEALDVVIDRAGEVRKRRAKTSRGSIWTGITSVGHALASSSVGYLIQVTEGATGRVGGCAAGGSFGIASLDARQDGSGSTPSGYSYAGGTGGPATVHGPEIVAASGTSAALKWAGSTQSRYSTGTVSTTASSTTVTGSGTTWTSAMEGMYLWINHATLRERAFRVTKVVSTTSLIVDNAPDATAATQTYALNPVGFLAAPDNLFSTSAGASVNDVRDASAMASHQGRLFVSGVIEYVDGTSYADRPERVRWSATQTETSGKFIGTDYWHASGYTDIGMGEGGNITGMVSFDGDLVIFKESAIYVLRGSVATDGTDLGASIDRIAGTQGVRRQAAIVATPYGVAFANKNGVFLYRSGKVDSLSSPISTKWNVTGPTSAKLSYLGQDDRLVATKGDYAFVFDMEQRTWTMQQGVADTVTGGNVVEMLNDGATDREIQLMGDTFIDWVADFSLSDAVTSDGHGTSYPRMRVTTHPIALGAGLTGQGRVNTVYVNGYVIGSTLTVTLVQGRSKGLGTGLWGAPVELAVGSVSAGTFDKTYRLPVDGASPQYSAACVKVDQASAATDARIYAIALDVSPTDNVA